MLEHEIKYFDDNINDWLKSESGRFVVIKGNEDIGFYDTFGDALVEGTRRFGLESYLIRKISLDQEKIKIPAMTIGVLHADPSYPIQR